MSSQQFASECQQRAAAFAVWAGRVRFREKLTRELGQVKLSKRADRRNFGQSYSSLEDMMQEVRNRSSVGKLLSKNVLPRMPGIVSIEAIEALARQGTTEKKRSAAYVML